MAELPGGTVTLVFTDIEGSTRLLASLGSRYEAVLADHRKLLRAVFSSHSGIEVDTQGDALFYAFPRAQDAVTAAVEAQQVLSSHDFGERVELRVRMGIHTGEPSLSDEGYVGTDVHIGARISAVAWGGQIVVSSATAALVSGDVDEISLRSLGHHALKDIDDRVELHQVVGLGLEEDFPALRSVSAHPTNLPARLAPLIGREDDIAAVVELLSSKDVSVVTLVGPGGTGKTRVALAVGAELLSSFSDGVFFVDLSALSDASLVVPAVAQTLSLREAAGRSLVETLGDYLSSKEMVLILDNFEQVMDAAGEVSALVGSSSSLNVVVTSREALRIEGEREFPLHPLALPSSEGEVGEILASPAVELFVARARAVLPGLRVNGEDARHVATICRRLDGLPLAIELAAARVKVLTLSSLASRLEKSLGALGTGRRDASDRQRTLTGAIAWSYQLLDEDEQRLFSRLGVFAGGWSLEAAEAVCDRGDLSLDLLDEIASLVDKSLVRAAGEQEPFSMLETIREFALEKLKESAEAEEIRRAHAEFFRALAQQSYAGLAGSRQVATLEQLRREQSNFRTASGWAMTAEPQISLHLSSNLWRFWRIEGQLAEGRRWLERSLEAADAPAAVRARALRGLSVIAEIQHDYATARVAAHEAMRLFDELQDQGGIARCLEILAGLSEEEGDLEGAAKGYGRTKEIYEQLGDEHGVAVALGNLANVALLREDNESALELTGASMKLYESQGDAEGMASSLLNRGLALLRSGTPSRSRPPFRRALALAVELHHKHLATVALEGLAAEAGMANDLERAARLLGAASQLRSDEQVPRDSLEQRFYADTLRLLREHFDSRDLDGLFGEGRHRSTDIVISEAEG